MQLKDYVAVITGGTSGIGEATARSFVDAGARVVIAGRSEKKGTALADRMGRYAVFHRTDVRDEEQIRELVDFTLSEFGHIDCLFNNAGEMGRGGGIAELTSDDFDDAIAVLLRSVFLGMKYAAPAMCRRGRGSIVNCASIAGLSTGRGTTLYSTAKAAVVNSISPGFITTPMMAGASGPEASIPEETLEAVDRQLAQMTPLRRAGTPEEIAKTVLFLASDDSSFINGQDIVVDAGSNHGELWRNQASRPTGGDPQR
jgi:NAD(P)-dependent dehydrogenase (short-subunit alcohol dehydrogenase family)